MVKLLIYHKEDYVKFLIRDTENNCVKVTREFVDSLMKEGKIPKCDNFYIQYFFTDAQVDLAIDENQSVIKMFEDYVAIYMKDISKKHRNIVLKVGVERYLQNAIV